MNCPILCFLFFVFKFEVWKGHISRQLLGLIKTFTEILPVVNFTEKIPSRFLYCKFFHFFNELSLQNSQVFHRVFSNNRCPQESYQLMMMSYCNRSDVRTGRLATVYLYRFLLIILTLLYAPSSRREGGGGDDASTRRPRQKLFLKISFSPVALAVAIAIATHADRRRRTDFSFAPFWVLTRPLPLIAKPGARGHVWPLERKIMRFSSQLC